MTVPVIAFFNNQGRVGKTLLVYHLAWMYADLNTRVVAVDLDPQADLSAAFLADERLEELWPESSHRDTIFGSVEPLIKGVGEIAEPHLEFLEAELALLVGDVLLSEFEDQLSEAWLKCSDGDERAFRVMSAFWRIMQQAAKTHQAEMILVDLGPNLGAINRAALIAADYVVVPLSPDLFSVQGLRHLGPTLRRWRKQWRERVKKNPADDLKLPKGHIKPIGYTVLQHSLRLDRPVNAYQRWMDRIPNVYRTAVLAEKAVHGITVTDDPYTLGLLKPYRSLIWLAEEARKPIFHLKYADGAIGSHIHAVRGAYYDFKNLAKAIAERTSKIKNSKSGAIVVDSRV